MSKIKTRESVKNVKVLDKAAVASKNMKKAFIRTKEQGQNLVDDGQASPSEYASDNLQYAVEDITQEAGHAATSGISKTGQKGREAYQQHKVKQAEKAQQPKTAEDAFNPVNPARERAAAQAKQGNTINPHSNSVSNNPVPSSQELRIADVPSEPTMTPEVQTYYRGRIHARKSVKQAQEASHRSIKVAQRSGRTIKQTAKSTGKASVKTAKGTIKTSQKAVKTAEATSKTAIKTNTGIG